MKVFRFRQVFDQPQERDVTAAVTRELAKLDLGELRGKSVAITAGSRGIPNIVEALAASVAQLRRAGAQPFIVPTMGSHGGGTAEGQIAVLERYGITPTTVGCTIRGEMDCRIVGGDEATPVYFSELLCAADAVLVVARVKCHTGFVGEIESGLCKMIAVGGGRYRGAQTIHRRAQEVGMERAVLAAAREIFKTGKIFGALALVDNARHQTAFVEAVRAQSVDAFIADERSLLVRANDLLAQLPFAAIDVCCLQEMGKNVSGTGSDPNVIGRRPTGWRIRELPRPRQAVIGQVGCCSLDPLGGGNATGVGLHDAISKRLFDAIDWEVTRLNAETSGALELIETPPVFDDDRQMLGAMIGSVGGNSTGNSTGRAPLVVFAPNTRDLEVLYASENALEEVQSREDLESDSDPFELPYDARGNLQLDFKT